MEPTNYREKFEEVSLLFEISQILDQSLDLKQVIQPVLSAVTDHMGMLRGAITLLNRNTDQIFIDAAYGLSPSERHRGRYQLGEGITGKVVQTGQAKIIPKVSEEPDFLNKTGARRGKRDREISFICVPIKIGTETIGALSVDREAASNDELQSDLRALSVVASMIAQAMKIRQGFMEEREQLLEENDRLHRELVERFKPSNIIGNSKAMQHVFDMIAQVSKSDATVLIRAKAAPVRN